MHLEDFVKDFTDEHRIVKHIASVIKKMRFLDGYLTITDLINWGNVIKTHWQQENATATAKNIELLSSQISSVEQRLIVTQESLKNVSRDVKILTEAFQEFSLMMKDVVRYTRTQEFIQSNSTLTPVAQRSKDSSRSGSGSKRSRFADLNSESVLITSHDDSSAGENVPPIANGDAIEALLHGREIPRIESLKNLTLQDMLVHWYEYEVFKASDLHCGSRAIKDKIKTVMKYITDTILTPVDVEQLSAPRPSEIDYLRYALWRNQLRAIANSISERAFKALEEVEQDIFNDKKKSRASNVTSIYERLMAIKQKQTESFPKYNECSNTLDQFLLKKK